MKIRFETEAEARARANIVLGMPGNQFAQFPALALVEEAHRVLGWAADFYQRELGLADREGEVLILGHEIIPIPVAPGVNSVNQGSVVPVSGFGPHDKVVAMSNKFLLSLGVQCGPDMMKALAHEMGHVRQFMDGEFAGSVLSEEPGGYSAKIYKGVIESDTNAPRHRPHVSGMAEMKRYEEWCSERDARETADRLMAAMSKVMPEEMVDSARHSCACRLSDPTLSVFEEVPEPIKSVLEAPQRQLDELINMLMNRALGHRIGSIKEIQIDKKTGEITWPEDPAGVPPEVRAQVEAHAARIRAGDTDGPDDIDLGTFFGDVRVPDRLN